MQGMEQVKEMLNRVLGNTEWKKLAGHAGQQCVALASDSVLWLAAITVVGLANVALGFLQLHGRQKEMMEAIHLNTVYAVVLVGSASTVSRLVVSALERLGHWERGE
jgi:hypothetical protein